MELSDLKEMAAISLVDKLSFSKAAILISEAVRLGQASRSFS
jgi:hypothetical protein